MLQSESFRMQEQKYNNVFLRNAVKTVFRSISVKWEKAELIVPRNVGEWSWFESPQSAVDVGASLSDQDERGEEKERIHLEG